MKITYLINGLYTGGAEAMLYKMLCQIDRTQFEPSVISMMDRGTWGDKIEALGVPVYTLDLTQGSSPLQALQKLRQVMRSTQPDLIHGNMYHANLLSQMAKRFAGGHVPVIWEIHHTLTALSSEKRTTQFLIRLGTKLAHQCDRIVYVSHRSRAQHEQLGYPSNKAITIPNGCDITQFTRQSNAHNVLCQSLGIPTESLLIGSMARFHEMKDHHNLLEAAAIAVPHFPNLHFALVGRDVTPENPQLQDWIRALNLGDRVHLLGERSDVVHLMSAFDLFTSSSAFGEAFPNVLVEAMACGTPCVTTDVGDCELIVGETGRTVPPKDAHALGNAWRALLSLPVADRVQLGQRARDRVVENFSMEIVMGHYETLYHTIVAETQQRQTKKSLFAATF